MGGNKCTLYLQYLCKLNYNKYKWTCSEYVLTCITELHLRLHCEAEQNVFLTTPNTRTNSLKCHFFCFNCKLIRIQKPAYNGQLYTMPQAANIERFTIISLSPLRSPVLYIQKIWSYNIFELEKEKACFVCVCIARFLVCPSFHLSWVLKQ